ncbi:'chromo' (CHRromatin Organization MOdifier) domain-containing protein [Toxoplasma gondii RUB]|uniref:'chromo' (CHRromatin Organization MOdifier) domain-containing protein n=1 Tax=Toxoplasma gondii RUB TaxID=935652 RepID=A0A086LXL3_TOXGO|nr:'chromo' (CHRromatin Organization MOdifier) domain-containing protein [Toxoplasma gondii RUB]
MGRAGLGTRQYRAKLKTRVDTVGPVKPEPVLHSTFARLFVDSLVSPRFLLVFFLIQLSVLFQGSCAEARAPGTAQASPALSFWRHADTPRGRLASLSSSSEPSLRSFLDLSPSPLDASQASGLFDVHHSDSLAVPQPLSDLSGAPLSLLPGDNEPRESVNLPLETHLPALSVNTRALSSSKFSAPLSRISSVLRLHKSTPRSASETKSFLFPSVGSDPADLSRELPIGLTSRFTSLYASKLVTPFKSGSDRDEEGTLKTEASRFSEESDSPGLAPRVSSSGKRDPSIGEGVEGETRMAQFLSTTRLLSVAPYLPSVSDARTMLPVHDLSESVPHNGTLSSASSLPPRSVSYLESPRENDDSRAFLVAYVTGFGPFGSVRNNPTACLVSNLGYALLQAQRGEAISTQDPLVDFSSVSREENAKSHLVNETPAEKLVPPLRSGVPFDDVGTSCSAELDNASSHQGDGRENSRIGEREEREAAGHHRGQTRASQISDSWTGKDGVFTVEETQKGAGERGDKHSGKGVSSSPPFCSVSPAIHLCGVEILEVAAAAAKEAALRIAAVLRSATCSWTEGGRTALSDLDSRVRNAAGPQETSEAADNARRTPATVTRSADGGNAHIESSGKRPAEVEFSEVEGVSGTHPVARMQGMLKTLSLRQETTATQVSDSERDGTREANGDEHAKASDGRILKKLALHLGLNQSATAFELEKVGVNEAHFSIPDQRGFLPEKQRISETGPERLLTNLPLEEICSSLRDRGFPCETSSNAGRFVCNYMYYQSLLENLNSDAEVLFVHVPPFSAVPYSWQVSFLLQLLDVIRRLPPQSTRRQTQILPRETSGEFDWNFRGREIHSSFRPSSFPTAPRPWKMAKERGSRKKHGQRSVKETNASGGKVKQEEPEYEVEDVVAYTEDDRGVARWKVRWKGYDSDEDTWETRANLRGSPAFWKQMDRLQREWRRDHRADSETDFEDESEAEDKVGDITRPGKAQARTRRGDRHQPVKKKRTERSAQRKAVSEDENGEEDDDADDADDDAEQEAENEDDEQEEESSEDESDTCYPIIYGIDTEPPPHHLPDETILTDGRLSVFRFKNIPVNAESHVGLSRPQRARESCSGQLEGGDRRRCAATREMVGMSREESPGGTPSQSGTCVYVQYLVDGKFVYSLPFERARFYCPQLLLSYLMARTTFKGSSVANHRAASSAGDRERSAEVREAHGGDEREREGRERERPGETRERTFREEGEPARGQGPRERCREERCVFRVDGSEENLARAANCQGHRDAEGATSADAEKVKDELRGEKRQREDAGAPSRETTASSARPRETRHVERGSEDSDSGDEYGERTPEKKRVAGNRSRSFVSDESDDSSDANSNSVEHRLGKAAEDQGAAGSEGNAVCGRFQRSPVFSCVAG